MRELSAIYVVEESKKAQGKMKNTNDTMGGESKLSVRYSKGNFVLW